MAENTKIQWATHTFNPWRGCTKVAPGCANRYAEKQSKRNPGTLGVWGPNGSRVVASEAMWRQPVAWNRDVEATVEVWKDDRPRVFCASLADVFEDWQGSVVRHDGCTMWECKGCSAWTDGALPTVQANPPSCRNCGQILRQSRLELAYARARLFRLIDATPNLDWLLLTKRPENVSRMWSPRHDGYFAQQSAPPQKPYTGHRPNVWLGTSIACQDDADRDVPELLTCRDLVSKLFLSIEPLIGPVDISRWLGPQSEGQWMNVVECGHRSSEYGINWVIVGGESGTNARPCDVAWIRSIVKQCRAAGVPVFVKQLGAVPECRCDEGGWQRAADGTCNDNSCRRVKLLDPKGGDPAEWTEDLRVREVPT